MERETESYTYLELEHRDVKAVSSKSCTTQFLHENSAVVHLNNYQVLPPQTVLPLIAEYSLKFIKYGIMPKNMVEPERP